MAELELAEALWAEVDRMEAFREGCGWGRKLEACSYVRHRVGGPEGVPEVRLYECGPVSYKDLVVNAMFGALYPADQQWFSLGLPGDRVSLRRRVRDEAADAAAPDAGMRRERRRSERAARSAERRWVTVDEVDGAKDALQGASREVLSAWMVGGYYEAKRVQVEDAYVLGFGVVQSVDEVGKDGLHHLWYRALDPRQCYMEGDGTGTAPKVFARRFRMRASEVWLRWHGTGRLPEALERGRAVWGDALMELVEMWCPCGWLQDAEGNVLGPAASGTRRWQHFVVLRAGVPDSDFGRGTLQGQPEPMGGPWTVECSLVDCIPVTVLWFGRHPAHMYGVGVVESVLEELVKANDLARTWQSLTQFAADPMYAAPLNLVKSFRPRPGLVVPMQGEQYPVQLGDASRTGWSQLYQALQWQLSVLKEMMWVNIFQTLMASTDSRKTATEVNYLKNEAAQMATGMIGNAQKCAWAEFRRALKVLEKADVVRYGDADVREVVHRAVLRFNTQFISQVQNFYMLGGITTLTNYVTSVYPVEPEVKDVIDFDQQARDVASAVLADELAVREASEVKAVREQRARLAQRQYESQMAQQDSQAQKNMAQARQAASGGR